MLLTLYKTTDSGNTVNKTLLTPLSITINLKRDTDIVNPTILLKGVNGLLSGDFNYFFIDELERYYFIERIDTVGGYLTRIEGVCDVLMTYKNDVLASYARVNRTLKTGDYIDTHIEKSHTSTVTKFESGYALPDEPTIILTTVGGSE